jgi:HD superfamily phosphodiesterase
MPNRNRDSPLTPALIAVIRIRHALDLHGVHGAARLAHVRRTGLALAARTGAHPEVVERFAFLHDACRMTAAATASTAGAAAASPCRFGARTSSCPTANSTCCCRPAAGAAAAKAVATSRCRPAGARAGSATTA